MASMWRFDKSDHPWIQSEEIWWYFMRRFSKLDGMTPDISKSIY